MAAASSGAAERTALPIGPEDNWTAVSVPRKPTVDWTILPAFERVAAAASGPENYPVNGDPAAAVTVTAGSAPTTIPVVPASVGPRPPAAPLDAVPVGAEVARPTSAAAAPVGASLAPPEQVIFAGQNAARAQYGVAALQLDGRLVAVARARAVDMATRGYFSHTSPTGETAFTLLARAQYAYVMAGENIARNNYAPAQAPSISMAAFMNSPSHRENVLEPAFHRVGVGYAIGAGGMFYFAVVFAE